METVFTNDMTTAPKYEVVSIGPNHYVVNVISRDFLGLGHKSRKSAQASCDRANLSREQKNAR